MVKSIEEKIQLAIMLLSLKVRHLNNFENVFKWTM